MTRRHGELEGHLYSPLDELGVAAWRAWRQTVDLALRHGRPRFAVVPNEAGPMIAAGARLSTGARLADLETRYATLCLESAELPDLALSVHCLLNLGHPGQCATAEFAAMLAAGEARQAAATHRLEGRYRQALEAARPN